jgi:K+-sensing histidine kinase KdpD
MIAYAIGRTATGDVILRAGVRDEAIAVEVTDNGPPLSTAEADALFQRPNQNGDRGTARALGLYIARAMAEAVGGRTDARTAKGRPGVTLVAEFPLDAQPLKVRTP